MSPDGVIEVLWLDQHHLLSLAELEQLSGLSADELRHLVESEMLLPVSGVAPAPQALFSAECLPLARMAARLRSDFDLDANALALALQLLRRIQALESELLALRAQRQN